MPPIFSLAGTLSNGGAHGVYQAWQTALSILGDRPLKILTPPGHSCFSWARQEIVQPRECNIWDLW